MVFADNTPGVILRHRGQFYPAGGGPTPGSWRCGPCERESELEGYGRLLAPMMPRSIWSDINQRGLGVHPRNHWHRQDHKMHGYQAVSVPGDWPPIEAGAVAAEQSAAGQSPVQSIALGVGTGIAVWVITRLLDRMVFGGGRR